LFLNQRLPICIPKQTPIAKPSPAHLVAESGPFWMYFCAQFL
jgi:hypothetical protein